MNNSWLSASGAALALVLAVQPGSALAQAQQGPGWFVPQHHEAPAARAPATRAAAPASEAAPVPAEGQPSQIQVQLPPAPILPPIQRGAPPPAAIIGIISTPELLHASTAYQKAFKELNDRKRHIDQDAQREAGSLREQEQALAKLGPEQRHQREVTLQDRSIQFRQKYTERSRIIQEQAQYAEAQINRTLGQIVAQVAQAHGVNLVLNVASLMYGTPEFDLTPEVARLLNKVLPAVVIPPEGVSPIGMEVPKSEPGAPEAGKEETKSAKPEAKATSKTKH